MHLFTLLVGVLGTHCLSGWCSSPQHHSCVSPNTDTFGYVDESSIRLNKELSLSYHSS